MYKANSIFAYVKSIKIKYHGKIKQRVTAKS